MKSKLYALSLEKKDTYPNRENTATKSENINNIGPQPNKEHESDYKDTT